MAVRGTIVGRTRLSSRREEMNGPFEEELESPFVGLLQVEAA
jgi:hypothetical protein